MQTGFSPRENSLLERVRQRLSGIYGIEDTYQVVMPRLLQLLRLYRQATPEAHKERWDQHDCFLITYGDSLHQPDQAPLASLQQFLGRHLKAVISTIHILPFFPYSSDDGFSVIDYRLVKPDLGEWDDIAQIGKDFDLMMDLVLNHISRKSLWFHDFKSGLEPYNNYFIEVSPDEDLSQVVRPRPHPLLVEVLTHQEVKHLWATFSVDQIDLNYKCPQVFLEFVDILMRYYAMGARVVRLDAVAFLWKELGTPCIHLPQTHELIKAFRDLFELIDPEGLILTETNVPHEENVSYFGQGDEAHLVYQFALPPLLLHAFWSGKGQYLSSWAKDLKAPPEGCSFMNFTASHDGIGLRGAEGILPLEERDLLLAAMRSRGGFVSMRSVGEAMEPYEINIAYYSALAEDHEGHPELQRERFMASQAAMLSFKGIPAIYFNSMVATENDMLGVELTGRTRSINRKKWLLPELESLLADPQSPQAQVFEGLKRLLAVRKQQPAFHPDGEQEVWDLGSSFLALLRRAPQSDQVLLALINLTPHPQAWPEFSGEWDDLLGSAPGAALKPYQVCWLVRR
ncbi:MAG: sugar phosphorylase [bacterium]|nr:sugar phosphorylase [bacterium]